MSLEADVLGRITPTVEEQRHMEQTVADLLAALRAACAEHGHDAEPAVQGSVAKGTWLRGNTDIDTFLVMAPDRSEEDLKRAVDDVAPAVLEAARHKYAQHPYMIGTFRGMQVDLVPAYAIQGAHQRLSAVDRTPLHTTWVAEHLDDSLRDAVRLAKAWCKGVGVYGAETAIGGFSGYLVEVLVHHTGGFPAFIAWLADTEPPVVVSGEPSPDDPSALCVADPVDAQRNCAAAVRLEVLETARAAARAYSAGPGEKFFFPPPPRAEDASALAAALSDQAASWLGLRVTPQTDRLDIVLPQFQRTARAIAAELQAAGFPVRRHRVDVIGTDVGMHWITDDVMLPADKVHRGPPARRQPNADRFRSKWEAHADRSGPVREADDGRLEVTVAVHERTPAAYLAGHLERLTAAKHVAAAVKRRHRIFADPADVAKDWAPVVADVVLDRAPWQR